VRKRLLVVGLGMHEFYSVCISPDETCSADHKILRLCVALGMVMIADNGGLLLHCEQIMHQTMRTSPWILPDEVF